MFKNRFFKVDIYDKDSKLLNITELYNQFKSIIDKYSSKSYGIGIGALTGDKRDQWARVFFLKVFINFFSQVNF